MDIMDVIGDVLVIFGALNFAICAIGLITFHDFYARVSAVGTAAGFGISFVVLGVWFKNPSLASFFVALVAILLLLGTSALGSMFIARSAALRGTQMTNPVADELGVLTPEQFEARMNGRGAPVEES